MEHKDNKVQVPRPAFHVDEQLKDAAQRAAKAFESEEIDLREAQNEKS